MVLFNVIFDVKSKLLPSSSQTLEASNKLIISRSLFRGDRPHQFRTTDHIIDLRDG